MTKEEAISYIEQCGSQTGRSIRPADNPDRTRRLLNMLDSPQRGMKFIHVCGSNGKGSVCAMLEAVLRAAGYRTGLFTSPHIQDFCERIRVDGEMISPQALGELCALMRPYVESMDEPIGYFCFVTALAISYFAQCGCDYVILETGIGGTYDATNAIDAPELAIVTHIGLEHTEILGDSLEQIAHDKAGIIKPGCACVAYDNPPAVNEVIRAVCADRQVPFYLADTAGVTVLSHGSIAPSQAHEEVAPAHIQAPAATRLSQQIQWQDHRYELSLLGDFQAANAALALSAVNVLRTRGANIPEDAVREGLSRVRWPARFEVLCADPLTILDGGHNPQCATALTQTLRALFGDTKVIFILGMMRDKGIAETLRILLPYAVTFVCVTPPDERGLPAEQMAELISSNGGSTIACSSVETALKVARAHLTPSPIIIFGSLYLAGEMRDIFGLRA